MIMIIKTQGKSKLNKNTKRFDVVFPNTFSRQSQQLDQMVAVKANNNKPQRIKSLSNKARSLTAQPRQSQHMEVKVSKDIVVIQKRAVESLQNKNSNKNSSNNRKTSISKRPLTAKQDTLSLPKKRASSLQSFYYDGMQKFLQSQCQLIPSLAPPNKYHPTTQPIDKDYLFVKSRFVPTKLQRKSRKSQNVPVKVIGALKNMQVSQSQMSQITQEDRSRMELTSRRDVGSRRQIKSVKKMEIEIESGVSLMGSRIEVQTPKQQLNQKALFYLQQHSFVFFLNKFSIKTATSFRLKRVQIINRRQFSIKLGLYLQLYNQIVYHSLSYTSNKDRKHDIHGRRNNIRHLQTNKQYTKQRAFLHLLRQGKQDAAMNFLTQVLSYIGNNHILVNHFAGLCLRQNIIQTKPSFYFYLKLNSTFYFVKAIFLGHQMSFTFLLDSSSLNPGNHLQFKIGMNSQNLAQIINKLRLKNIFFISTKQFIQLACRQLGQKQQKMIQQQCEVMTRCCVTGVSLQSWKGQDWWQNKQYALGEGMSNFFIYHRNFDYGFTSQRHPFQRSQQYIYSPDSLSPLVLYSYKQGYIHIPLVKAQQQAFMIAHIPNQLVRQHAGTCRKYFIKRYLQYREQKVDVNFIFMCNKKKVKVRSNKQNIEVTISAISSTKSDKIFFPIDQFIAQNRNILTLQRILRSKIPLFTRNKTLAYSNLSLDPSPKTILHKSLHKIQSFYVHISISLLPLHHTAQFRLLFFHFGKQFVMQLDPIQLINNSLAEIVNSIIFITKETYFSRMLAERAARVERRSQIMGLAQFNSRYARNKNIMERQARVRISKLASLQIFQHVLRPIYQNITQQHFQISKYKYYLTIRYAPAHNMPQNKNWHTQQIQLSLKKQQKLTYLRLRAPLKDLIYSVTQGQLQMDFVDAKRVYQLLKDVKQQIKRIVGRSRGNMQFVRNHVKNIMYRGKGEGVVGGEEMDLLDNQLHVRPKQYAEDQVVQSKVSIQDQLQLRSSKKQMISSRGSIDHPKTLPDLTYQRPIRQPFVTTLTAQHMIQVVDIKHTSMHIQSSSDLHERQIWVVDRYVQKRFRVVEVGNDFMAGICLTEYNRRMIKRTLKAVRMAL